ncbi:MAG: hypothetical protein ABIZ95_10405 [Pyrinomonadaceae bacterium]
MANVRRTTANNRKLIGKLAIGLAAALSFLLGAGIVAAGQTRKAPVAVAKKTAAKRTRSARRRPAPVRPRHPRQIEATVPGAVSAEISAGKPIKPSETNIDLRTLPPGKPEHEGEGQAMSPVRDPPAAKAKKRRP